MRVLAQVPRGFGRTTMVCVTVRAADVTLGAGRVDCIECEGNGWWDYGPDEEVPGECVECKGTGKIWIST